MTFLLKNSFEDTNLLCQILKTERCGKLQKLYSPSPKKNFVFLCVDFFFGAIFAGVGEKLSSVCLVLAMFRCLL